jgi:hypothetical protein
MIDHSGHVYKTHEEMEMEMVASTRSMLHSIIGRFLASTHGGKGSIYIAQLKSNTGLSRGNISDPSGERSGDQLDDPIELTPLKQALVTSY